MAFPYSKQTWTDNVSSGSGSRFTVMEDGIALAGVAGTSSTPPASPVDGMIWRLPADSSNGVYWFFQYDSSQATNKWVFMGGPPMFAAVNTDQTTGSLTYVDLGTVGPSITIPRSGDYIIELGFGMAPTGSNFTDVTMLMAAKLGGAATSDANAVGLSTGSTAAQGLPSATRKLAPVALTAADVVKAQYRIAASSGTSTTHFVNRHLFVTPVRII